MKETPRVYIAETLPEGGGPVALESLVPGTGPLLLEIGPGRGAFAVQYAALHPDHRLLAFEIRRKLAWEVADRLAAKKLTNARCFGEDARVALARLTPDASVSFAAIHFPDPWWKKRHAKRLVVADTLMNELSRLMKPGGLLLVQTDVEHRGLEYAERLDQCTAFERAWEGAWAEESPFAPARSNRETRAIADGLPIYRMIYRRRANTVL